MNTEQKHTPGPWSTSSAFGVISNDEVICRVRRIRKEQGEANARLIAAAPELLAALKHITSNCRVFCEDSMDIDDGAVYDARAAIAKAEGKA